jgi:hypothetical protein
MVCTTCNAIHEPVRLYVHKWGVKDWRVMRKDFHSVTSYTVSQHTTKQAAQASLRKAEQR